MKNRQKIPENSHFMSPKKLVVPDFRKAVARKISENDPNPYESEVMRKDGSTFPVLVKGRSLTLAGEIIRITTLLDISDRKAVEVREMHARGQVEMASRAKTELLANMSHELRTPLNAIIGFSQVMQGEFYGPMGHEKYQQYATDITNSGKHLLNLINDILDVSAIESGKLNLIESKLNIPKVLEACTTMIQMRVEEGQIGFTTKIDKGLPRLFGDERRVKQILLNLLSNAVKFTLPEGKVMLHAGVTPSGEITLSVKDTGIGMDQAGIIKSLEQFGQVDSSLFRMHEGSGLGLPLTVGLVKLHDGELDIQSAKGEGTVVTVTFPPERTLTG